MVDQIDNLKVQLILLILAMIFLTARAHAQDNDNLDVLPDPAVGPLIIQLEVVASGLFELLDPINNNGPSGASFPTDAAALPDGTDRVLVMTLKGSIMLLDQDGSLSLFHNFVDPAVTEIRPRNFGPTAIAVHPDFAANGKFYTVETQVEGAALADFGSGTNHQDVLYEYTMSNPMADSLAASGFAKRELMRIDQPLQDHNVNDLAFMNDRTMLISIGDGGNTSGTGSSQTQLDASDRGKVHGKLLRIDPLGSNSINGEYGLPLDNPFIDVAGVLPEIYSYGHRNPFRVHVDPMTNEVWVGEVGQLTVEEVNRVTAGGNYGWASKEGSFLFADLAGDADGSGTITNADVAPDPDANTNGVGDFADANGLIDPIFEYDHSTGDSVAGGLVYRGTLLAPLHGVYIFGDTDTSEPGGLFYGPATATPAAGALGQMRRLKIDAAGAPAPPAIVGFAEDGAGEVLILTTGGEILRIVGAIFSADLNDDGVVDGADLGILLGAWGKPGIADLDGNSTTDGADLGILLGAWG